MSRRRGKQWVLLAAGSTGWINYRHQANVCNVYQMVHSNGIPDEQIIVMMSNDIALNSDNPYEGIIINEPNGPNVYSGVPFDYTADDVSAHNFLAVLRGDEKSVIKNANAPKKILKSDRHDTIFIYLSDHGGAGLFQFPKDTLHASDLVSTIEEMSERQQFSKMVIYVESCHSGSMIENLPNNVQVYGVSASSPSEPHHACFYDRERLAFLSGEFTACWLQHSKMSDLTKTTFQDQFAFLKKGVTKSTPYQYGNMEVGRLFISDFLGCPNARTQAEYVRRAQTFSLRDLTPSYNVPVIIAQDRITRERNPTKKRDLQKELDKLLQTRTTIEKAMQDIARHACPERADRALRDRRHLTNLSAMKHVAEHFRLTFKAWHEEQNDGFILSRTHVLVNLCEYGVHTFRIQEAINYVYSQKFQ